MASLSLRLVRFVAVEVLVRLDEDRTGAGADHPDRTMIRPQHLGDDDVPGGRIDHM